MPATRILPDRRRVVIVGGGAVGSSIAFHLASRPDFAGSVTVVERDPSYARASSSLSASSIRQQFSTPLNIALSQAGLAFLREAERVLAVDGEGPGLGLRLPGYLFLASPEGVGVLRENHAVQVAAGAEVALLDPDGLKTRFPWLSTDGVSEGALGLSGEGWFDGPALLAGFRRRARSLGVSYVAKAATGFERAGAALTGVRLEDGAVLPAELVVNAAGAWSWQVAAWLGIDLPVRPRRRMVFVIACRDRLPGCPLVIDPTGIWFRPEGAGFICGRSPGEGEPDPDEPPLEVDEAEFTERVWPVLAGRVPAFEAVKVTGSWAGYYEMNLFDGNGVVGPHPEFANFIFAAGFSGHGMQHSPAIGRGVAELIAGGGYETLDLSPLGFSRIPDGRRLVERNIV
jgi:glycine/D-amino acid oxidase-like deaminating enzyme